MDEREVHDQMLESARVVAVKAGEAMDAGEAQALAEASRALSEGAGWLVVREPASGPEAAAASKLRELEIRKDLRDEAVSWFVVTMMREFSLHPNARDRVTTLARDLNVALGGTLLSVDQFRAQSADPEFP